MKKILIVLLLHGWFVMTTVAQNKPLTMAGLTIYGNYNLYNWQAEGSHSTGQAMNVLPGVGIGFWLCPTNALKISADAGIEFLPYSFDTDRYEGIGTLNFPALLRFTYSDGVRGIFVPLSLAVGVEFFKK